RMLDEAGEAARAHLEETRTRAEAILAEARRDGEAMRARFDGELQVDRERFEQSLADREAQAQARVAQVMADAERRRPEADALAGGGPVVLAAIETDGVGDPRAEMLEDLAERLGAGRTLIVMSPGASSLGSRLAASGGATWLQDADGEAFAALGLTYKRIGR